MHIASSIHVLEYHTEILSSLLEEGDIRTCWPVQASVPAPGPCPIHRAQWGDPQPRELERCLQHPRRPRTFLQSFTYMRKDRESKYGKLIFLSNLALHSVLWEQLSQFVRYSLCHLLPCCKKMSQEGKQVIWETKMWWRTEQYSCIPLGKNLG